VGCSEVLFAHVKTNEAARLGSKESTIVCYPFSWPTPLLYGQLFIESRKAFNSLTLSCSTHFLDTTKGIVTLRAFGFVSENKAVNSHLLDTSQRPAYMLQMIQNWLNLVLGLVVMVMAVVLTSLAVKLRSGSGFTGASLVTLMSFGDQLSGIVLFMTQLETSIGRRTPSPNSLINTADINARCHLEA
jgi:hypothetical protein